MSKKDFKRKPVLDDWEDTKFKKKQKKVKGQNKHTLMYDQFQVFEEPLFDDQRHE